jgi:hypothetical protein
MPDKHDDDLDQTAPQAKRTGREDPNPREQPGEFVDEMRSNRFGDVPEPPEK